MSVNAVEWLGVAAVVTLVGVAGALGHVVLASELGVFSYLVLAFVAAVVAVGIGHVAMEVSRRHQREIERHNAELAALNAVAVTASRSLELSSVLSDCLEKTLEVMGLDAGAVFLVSQEEIVSLVAHRGLTDHFLEALARMKMGESVSGSVVVPDSPLLVTDQEGQMDGEGIRASVRVPLRSEGRVVGAMYLFSRSYRNFSQRDVQILVAIGDVIGMAVQNAKLHAQVREHAARDPLTGLYNRRRFEEVYRQEVARARRYQAPLTVAMIDVDCFKEVNDRFGHAAGDRALEAIAEILLNGRSADTAARYGGDEFVILMPNTELEGAQVVAERIRRAASAVVFPDIPYYRLSLSIGLADSSAGYEGILERADAQMYACKRGGTNAPFSIH
jgi:diguanylate cyclase (GGDEF)-like protein